MLFFMFLLMAGMPLGLLFGCLPVLLSRDGNWIIPSIQITWGTMIGMSMVPAQRAGALGTVSNQKLDSNIASS